MLAVQEPSGTSDRCRTDWAFNMNGSPFAGDEYRLPDVSVFQVKPEPCASADDSHQRGDGFTSAARGGRGLKLPATSAATAYPFYSYTGERTFPSQGGSMDTPAVERMVMEQIQHDITSCARSLCIDTNPELWSVADAGKWLAWMVETYRLPRIADCLAFDGPSLCSISEEELTLLCGSPEVGGKVAAQLEVWKNACKLRSTAFSYFPTSNADRCEYSQQHQLLLPATAASAALGSPTDGCGGGLSPTAACSPYSSCSDVSQSSCDGMSSHDESSQDCMGSGQPSPRFGRQPVHLWEFLKELLLAGEEDCIQWVDRPKGIFRIHDSTKVAKLWGQRKNRPAMNYDKLSRSIRQYYKKGIIKKTAQSKRLVYQFCEPFLSR